VQSNKISDNENFIRNGNSFDVVGFIKHLFNLSEYHLYDMTKCSLGNDCCRTRFKNSSSGTFIFKGCFFKIINISKYLLTKALEY